MELFEGLVDHLAAPPRLFTLALVLFLASRGSKLPFSRGGGMALAGLGLVLAFAGLSDAGCRRLLLHPESLPVVILVLSSSAVLWFEMRRLRLPGGAGTPGAAAPGAGISTADAITATAVGLALVACTMLLPPPLGLEADPTVRPDLVKAPWFFVGLQELELYLDPWVPYLALPLLLVAGLFGLPYLRPPEGGPTKHSAGGGATERPAERPAEGGPTQHSPNSLFLFGWLLLWLWPMVAGALLRGPHWIAFGPFEVWQTSLPAPPAPRNLSEVFWLGWLRGTEPVSWWFRELPGVLLVAALFVLLPIVLRRWRITGGAFASYRKTLGTWRFRLTLAWILALMVVPLKMYGWWLWGIGYWIHVPELSFRF